MNSATTNIIFFQNKGIKVTIGLAVNGILANCPVFGGTSRFFHSSIELIFSSVPLLHEISPLCPAFFYSCIILFYYVLPCPAKFNAASRFYHGSGWYVWNGTQKCLTVALYYLASVLIESSEYFHLRKLHFKGELSLRRTTFNKVCS